MLVALELFVLEIEMRPQSSWQWRRALTGSLLPMVGKIESR